MMLSTKEAYCLFFNLGILGILAHFRHLESAFWFLTEMSKKYGGVLFLDIL
jgi:predicted component of type VI protein secretion system